jgi:hypothetical protein
MNCIIPYDEWINSFKGQAPNIVDYKDRLIYLYNRSSLLSVNNLSIPYEILKEMETITFFTVGLKKE